MELTYDNLELHYNKNVEIYPRKLRIRTKLAQKKNQIWILYVEISRK
jgi:hypothetical protein